MAATLAATLKASLSWVFQDALDLATVQDPGRLEFTKNISTGTGADLADRIWHDTRSILTTANDDLDLTALALSLFGSSVSINLVKVKGILVVNNSTTAGEELLVKADATNGFTGWCNAIATSVGFIGPASPWLVSSAKDGWATSGSNKVLRVHNPNGTTVSYSIVIFGTSA